MPVLTTQEQNFLVVVMTGSVNYGTQKLVGFSHILTVQFVDISFYSYGLSSWTVLIDVCSKTNLI